MPQRLIIIGGGINGLVLARELAAFFDITIIESASQCGGRIQSYPAKGDNGVIEAGAEFIHGKLKHTIALLDEAGIIYEPIAGKMYRKDATGWHAQEEMIEGWDDLLKEMKKVKQDMTLNEFLRQFMNDEKYIEVRKQARQFAAGFDLADPDHVSVMALYKEWTAEEEVNYRLPRGYGQLVSWLIGELRSEGVKLVTGDNANQIDWEEGEVRVYTGTGLHFDGEAVVLTVPASILARAAAKNSINITPPIDAHVQAAAAIGMGAIIKFVFEFNETLWPADAGFIFSDESIPTWWTQLPDSRPVLTGWLGGPDARKLAESSDEELIDKAIISLSNILDKPSDLLRSQLRQANVFNWQKNEGSLGGYSYEKVGSSDAKKMLQRPVRNTLYFSGEGVHDGSSPGTVEAAIIQAKKTAVQILEARKLNDK